MTSLRASAAASPALALALVAALALVGRRADAYAPDAGNCLVASTFAGPETAVPAETWGLAVNNMGVLFVVDVLAGEILQLNSTSDELMPYVGRFGTKTYINDAVASKARARMPIPLVYHRGLDAFYFSDWSNIIRRVLSNGTVEHVAGNESQRPSTEVFDQTSPFRASDYDGNARSANFGGPFGMCLDEQGDRAFVVDVNTNSIRMITNLTSPSALRVTTIAGTGVWGFTMPPDGSTIPIPPDYSHETPAKTTALMSPSDCAFDAKRNHLYFPVGFAGAVLKLNLTSMLISRLIGHIPFNTTAISTGLIEEKDNTTGTVGLPFSLAMDTNGDLLYFSEATPNYDVGTIGLDPPYPVRHFAGKPLAFLNGEPVQEHKSALEAVLQCPGRMVHLSGLVHPPNGVLYIANYCSGTLSRVEGGFVNQVGNGGVVKPYGQVDSIGVDARFNRPSGLAVDKSGNILVADSGNSAVRRISPAGSVTTLTPVNELKNPRGVAVSDTFIYVSDTDNMLIKSIDVNKPNALSVLAGSGARGFMDGTTSASFTNPSSIALAGRFLYVIDFTPIAGVVVTTDCRVRQVDIMTKEVKTLEARTSTHTSTGVVYNLSFTPFSGIAVLSASNGLGAQGDIFVASVSVTNNCFSFNCVLGVVRISADGLRATMIVGGLRPSPIRSNGYGSTGMFFSNLQGMAFLPTGELIVGEQLGWVRILNTSGYLSTFFESELGTVVGSRNGRGKGIGKSKSSRVGPDFLAVDSRTGDVIVSSVTAHTVVRIGQLKGDAACNDEDAHNDRAPNGAATCGFDTYIDFARQACFPCPDGTTSALPYALYCRDQNNKAFSPGTGTDQARGGADAATQGEASTATALGVVGTLAAAFFLAFLYSQHISRQRQRTAKLTAEASAALSDNSAVNALVSSINKARRSEGGAGSARSLLPPASGVGAMREDDDVAMLSFSDLAPDTSIAPLFGGFGVVFAARWVSRGMRVAVKVPKDLVVSGYLPPAAAAELVKEAQVRVASVRVAPASA